MVNIESLGLDVSQVDSLRAKIFDNKQDTGNIELCIFGTKETDLSNHIVQFLTPDELHQGV